MPATILFKAMGMSKEQILDYFYTQETYRLEERNTIFWEVRKELYRKDNAYADIVDSEGNVIVKAGKPITKRSWRLICEAGIEAIEMPPVYPGRQVHGRETWPIPTTGQLLAEAAVLKHSRDGGPQGQPSLD